MFFILWADDDGNRIKILPIFFWLTFKWARDFHRHCRSNWTHRSRRCRMSCGWLDTKHFFRAKFDSQFHRIRNKCFFNASRNVMESFVSIFKHSPWPQQLHIELRPYQQTLASFLILNKIACNAPAHTLDAFKRACCVLVCLPQLKLVFAPYVRLILIFREKSKILLYWNIL